MTGYRVSQPLMLENLELANRFVGLPIGLSGYVDQHGSPMEPLFDLYRRRAQGGVGLVIVEVSYIDPYPCSRPGLLGFYSDKLIPLFTRLTDVIHASASGSNPVCGREGRKMARCGERGSGKVC